MLNILAHAGELHDEQTTQAEHYISEPYVAIPLFILSLVGLYLILTKLLHVSKARSLLVLIGLQFIVGTISYVVSPVLSVLAISVGMGMSLMFVLSSLSK